MGGRDWWRVAPVVFALAWGGNHFTPLLQLYRERQGYTQVEVDLLFAVYILGLVPGFLLAGPLSDRRGRKPLIVASAVLGCAGSAVLAAGAGALPVLAAGRFVSGLSVATAMVVGTAWIKELSGAPRPAVPVSTAARRGSLTLTAGFGIGPAVSGSLAEWGPLPTVLPYLVQIAVTLLACGPLAAAPETREPGRPLRAGAPPAEVRRRFTTVVLPAAPWVFGAAGVAFAVVPVLTARQTGGGAIAYATLLAVVGLAVGAAVQPLAASIGRATGGRELLVGLSIAVVGLLLAAVVAASGSAVLGVLDAVVLGAAYGLCIVSGLAEVQRIAPPEHLAALTAVYYSATYLGFVLPVVLAALAAAVPYAGLLIALAVLCAGCLTAVARGLGRARRAPSG